MKFFFLLLSSFKNGICLRFSNTIYWFLSIWKIHNFLNRARENFNYIFSFSLSEELNNWSIFRKLKKNHQSFSERSFQNLSGFHLRNDGSGSGKVNIHFPKRVFTHPLKKYVCVCVQFHQLTVSFTHKSFESLTS